MAHNSNSEKTHLFDNPRNVSIVLRTLYVICAGLFIVDFFVHRHTMHSWEELPAFYAIYGFIGCVLLVLVAKVLRKLVMRKEDYYDVDE